MPAEDGKHYYLDGLGQSEVAKFAKRFRFKAFLLDTWGKDGKTLLDNSILMCASSLFDGDLHSAEQLPISGLFRQGLEVLLGGVVARAAPQGGLDGDQQRVALPHVDGVQLEPSRARAQRRPPGRRGGAASPA